MFLQPFHFQCVFHTGFIVQGFHVHQSVGLVGRLDVVVLNVERLYFRHAGLYAEMCEHGNGDDEMIPHVLNGSF